MHLVFSEKLSKKPRAPLSSIVLSSLVVCLVALVSSYYLSSAPPPREAHPFEFLNDIWTDGQMEVLRQMWQDVPSFSTVREDSTSRLPHIGEATPPLPDGSCPHRYLIS